MPFLIMNESSFNAINCLNSGIFKICFWSFCLYLKGTAKERQETWERDDMQEGKGHGLDPNQGHCIMKHEASSNARDAMDQ